MEKRGKKCNSHFEFLFNKKILNSKRSNSHFEFLFNGKSVNSKRSQAGIIAAILIILIVIVAVAIVWNIVSPLVRQKSGEVGIEKFTTNLEIKQASLLPKGVLKIDVSRGAGGTVDSLKFIFYDETGNSKTEEAESLGELETKTYSFSHPSELGKIKKVAAIPVIGNRFGLEDEENTKEVLEIPSGVAKWIKFDKLNNPVDYHSDESLVFENQMAISFWVEDSGSIVGNNYKIAIENQKVNFSYSGGSFEPANELEVGWNHVVVSIDINGVSKIYVNNKVEIFPINSLNVNNANLSISGKFDDIMVFNKALSSIDVNGLYVYQKK